MSFISELVPSRLWVETYLVQPSVEGSERLGKAYHGHYTYQYHPGDNGTDISLKDRFILGLSGLALSIPLVNTVVWIFMQTFLGEKPSQRGVSNPSKESQVPPSASPSSRAFGRSSGIVFDGSSGRSGPSSESERQ